MSSLDVFLPKVLQRVPNCPEPTALEAIREAAIEFCERTRLWRATLTCAADTNPVQIVAYDATPDANELTLPADAELLPVGSIEIVYFDDVKMTAKSTADLDEQYPDWRTSTDTGLPKYVTQLVFDELRFFPSFVTGDVQATVHLRPVEGALTLPDFLAAKYKKEIAWGAVGKLLMLPKQPFSDPTAGVYYADKFEKALDDNTSAKARGQQGARLRMKPTFF